MNVSILICTYGDPEWAQLARERAVPSAEQQSPYELIVEHDEEMYLDEVRNMTADLATGDWLCFLDADDELAPGYLEAMSTFYQEWSTTTSAYTPMLLTPKVQYIHEDGREDQPIFPNSHAEMEVMNRCVIGTLIPHHLFKGIGGFKEEPCYEDWALFLRCLKQGAVIRYIHDAVYRAHARPTSRNLATRDECRQAYEQIRREHLAA